MRNHFSQILLEAKSLDDVFFHCRRYLEKSVRTYQRLGYVSGIISSDGDQKISTNIKRLLIYTSRIENRINFPVFSAADIFCDEVFTKLKRYNKFPSQAEFIFFWRQILKVGITDILMTPRWRRSEGAVDEYKTAQQLKIKIHDLYPGHPLINGEKGQIYI